MERHEYFLSLADLEQIDGGSSLEIVTKEGNLVVLTLAKDEEEE